MRTSMMCFAATLLAMACSPQDDMDAGASTRRDTAVPIPDDGGLIGDGDLPINCADETGWCPCREEMNGGSYYLFCIAAATQESAAETCGRMGYQLAKIDDATEHQWVWDTAVDHEDAEGDWWIGLDDKATEGSFVWADGTPLGDYAPWGPDQPDDNASNPSQGEDCVHLSGMDEGAFNDLDCEADYLNFVCEARL